MPAGCMRCRTFTPLMQLGALWVCPPCFQEGFAPDCGLFLHPWQGSEAGWVCVRCGATLAGQTPVAAAPAPAPAWDD
jgi:DNA-directed RNA polymerase subunit RPC12/RpoP